MSTTPQPLTIDIPIVGMDCAECAQHVEGAICRLTGVRQAQVLLAAERATVTFDPDQVSLDEIKGAVRDAGYSVRETTDSASPAVAPHASPFAARSSALLLVVVFSVIALAVVIERLGWFDRLLDHLPWWAPALVVVAGGWPIFRNVFQGALRGQITNHSLMTVGVVAAALIGQWATAILLVFFMRFGDWVETVTTDRSRRALQDLMALQPQQARVMRDGAEVAMPVAQVRVGDVTLVRPGERIPVDGVVVDGEAPVDQSPITGESAPVDVAVGASVFAATIVQAGFLKVETTGVGRDTAFGRIVRLVEEAETHKAPVQRFADRFASLYLPLVVLIAVVTFLVTGQVTHAVAVLVVSCACAITLATPVVVLASVGAAARQGLLVKGGLALERLAHIDTVVMDKTGTLTWGAPRVTDVVPLNGIGPEALLSAVASAEARSEHPLARALVQAARPTDGALREPTTFASRPGRGVVATVDGQTWAVGNRRLLDEQGVALDEAANRQAEGLEKAGKTVFFAAQERRVVGLVALADTVRPEVRDALADLKALGVRRLVLLTGDNDRVAAAIAQELGLEYHAGLLPQDKIAIVKALQEQGARVLMVGDGVNDAPALAQADVGMAMGVRGTDVALEAADVALLRDDWRVVPQAIRLGRRARGTIRQNLLFTAVYNTLGIGLAALGILPPVLAAAAQSVPDVAIMLNSARLAQWRGH